MDNTKATFSAKAIHLKISKVEFVKYEQNEDIYRYHKDLDNPIILNPNKEYEIKIIKSIISNIHQRFYVCKLFCNDMYTSHFGTKSNDDYQHVPFIFTNDSNMIPPNIQSINIEINLGHLIHSILPNIFQLDTEFNFEFLIVEKELQYQIITSIEEDICCICYDKTFTTTICKHYVCVDCFRKLEPIKSNNGIENINCHTCRKIINK